MDCAASPFSIELRDPASRQTGDSSDSMSKKVLLTSICRPIGPSGGKSPSVGYELLHCQVTRAQGIFSPRTVIVHFSLDYIAENIEAPAVVLQFPSKREFIRELKRGYDYVGITFVMALLHKLKDMVELVRMYAPNTKIVLGGYGTTLSDEVLAPYADYICREEGVAYFRRLLGESELPMPYKHPLTVSWLKIFGIKVSGTGKIFAGLGCPNGCDFCCTSHYFGRKHIKLLPTGQDIYAVAKRYLQLDPKLVFLILDEDFLLNKKRALEFRDCVVKGGNRLSIFVFSSIKAISQYTVEEILEMGIDGFWIGYEGTRSNYAKQQGRPVEEVVNEFRQHGITILTSMIVGFDYQSNEVIADELNGLMALKPALSQFLIYGPVPGTPFHDRIIKANRLQDAYATNKELFYLHSDGFQALIKHPAMSSSEIESAQRWCFDEDFQRLGPSIYRVLDTLFLGYSTLRDSPNPNLREKAAFYASELRKSYPVFLAGKLFGPNRTIRRWIAALERQIHARLGAPSLAQRLLSWVAVAAAMWTWLTLRIGFLQHPTLQRASYRMPTRPWGPAELIAKFDEEAPLPTISLNADS